MATDGEQRNFDFERGEQLRILRLCQVGCPYAKLLLRTLDDHIGVRNAFWDLSFEELALEMNCSESAARDKAKALADLALIDIDESDEPKKKRFRITWLNLQDTIENPVKTKSRKPAQKSVQMNNFSPSFAACDSQPAQEFSQAANDRSQCAQEFSQAANDTTYKRQKRQRTPPPPSGSAWEEVEIELSHFGLNCAGKAIAAAQRRGMNPEDVGELLRVARETPYHDDKARPAILYRRLTDWNDFYWAPPPDDVKARKAAAAATQAAKQQHAKYREQEQARARRRRQDAEDWQQFEKLPDSDKASISETARSRASPIVRRSESGMKFETLKAFRQWREKEGASNV